MSSSAEIHRQGVRDNSSVSHLPGLALRAQFETSCPGHRLSLLPVDTKLMISWLSLDCGCRTSCHPIKAFSIMVDVNGPLLSPVFRDEDEAPWELIGHGALQAENKLSGASCQERLMTVSVGGTLPLRKHNVSSCTWLNINLRGKAGLRRYFLSHAEEQEEDALNMELACQELDWPNKAISQPLFVRPSKTRWQRMSEKIALSVLLLY